MPEGLNSRLDAQEGRWVVESRRDKVVRSARKAAVAQAYRAYATLLVEHEHRGTALRVLFYWQHGPRMGTLGLRPGWLLPGECWVAAGPTLADA